MRRENETGKKASLPEVLELDGLEEANEAVMLMDEAVELRDRLSKKVDDDEYDPKIHLARRYEEVKERLAEIQAESGLEGLRHNDVVFTARLSAGRSTLNKDALIQALLSRGVRDSVIIEAIAEATKTGEAFWVRELSAV